MSPTEIVSIKEKIIQTIKTKTTPEFPYLTCSNYRRLCYKDICCLFVYKRIKKQTKNKIGKYKD